MKIPVELSIVVYAAKMLAAPLGTRFEFHGQRVGRVVYAKETFRLLWSASHPGRMTIRRRWVMSRLYRKLEDERWHFFGYHPVGVKILAAVDRLHARFPKSSAIRKLWLYCLPF